MDKSAVYKGQRIMNDKHDEWGTFEVLKEYTPGMWEIKGMAGVRLLDISECGEWKELPF